MKRHHKIIIGSFSSLVVIFMIISSISLYMISIKQEFNYNNLNNKLSEIKADTQNKMNELSLNLLETKKSLEENQKELVFLKASAGEDFSGIIEDAIKSVVTIITNSGQGTGFIISDKGYVVTNAHVLADEFGRLASGIKAITYGQEIISADFIGYNGTLDIALLKISGDYDELKLADSDDVQRGEKVIAIGNPLGLQFSVTEGIVSAVHREGITGEEVYLQIDAPLNPGNSGGPLINKKGKVIGINNFKISGGESLGFALECNYVKSTINEIAQEALNQTLID